MYCIGLYALLYCVMVSSVRSSDFVDSMMDTIRSLGDQLRIQQLAQEMSVRSRGNSGIKRTRDELTGTMPYYGSSYVGRSVAAMHNHANERRTIGMGEVVAVLNGVEFKSRHNDFLLMAPSKRKKNYMKQHSLEFPDVPIAVMDHRTVSGQVKEMQLWFKAFHEQDYSVRDYRKHFKPALCYMEGGWTNDNDTLREPFHSRRHKLRASSYSDLINKYAFETNAGAHMPSEDYAYLPKKIVDYVINAGSIIRPVFSQWSYRIACHALKNDLPTRNIVPVFDLAKRMAARMNYSEYINSRVARFNIQTKSERDSERKRADPMPRAPISNLLDSLMSEIPGKDNYPGNLHDETMESAAYGFDAIGKSSAPKLNAAYYHRMYSTIHPEFKKFVARRRSYSDETLFMAMNSRTEMTETEMNYCNTEGCRDIKQRWTYAIPLEIVYMTPLSSWNPRQVRDRGSDLTSLGRTVTKNGRNGSMAHSLAFYGINDKYFFQTPEEFFDKNQPNEDFPADTGMGVYGVMDARERVQRMMGSGNRILMPVIPGIKGRVRTRYPIGPVHEEGSAVWKEYAAVRDLVIDTFKYTFMFDGN